MRSIAVAVTMFLMMTGLAHAAPASPGEARRCLVEVLRSEELPIGPLFHHTIKAILLVTPPDATPFETTVYKVIPWQVPPPRQGKRVRTWCDPAALNPSVGPF
jgi:hypothetical protein